MTGNSSKPMKVVNKANNNQIHAVNDKPSPVLSRLEHLAFFSLSYDYGRKRTAEIPLRVDGIIIIVKIIVPYHKVRGRAGAFSIFMSRFSRRPAIQIKTTPNSPITPELIKAFTVPCQCRYLLNFFIWRNFADR